MILGGSLIGVAYSGGGQTATTLPVTSPQATLAPAAATSVAIGGGSVGLSTARKQQLLQGAVPTTAAEQQWTTAIEGTLRSYVTLLKASATATSQRAEDHAFEQRVLELVNQQRAANGLQPLSYDARLDLASERHNAVQAATSTMAHQGIGDADPGTRIRATGFTNAWGENVATGQTSPEQVVAEWMASPGHRRNILDANYTRLGVSYTVGADGRTYWAQSFGA